MGLMMYNSNWVDAFEQINASMNIYSAEEEIELLRASQSLCFNENYLFPETLIDPLYAQNNNLFLSDENGCVLNPYDQHHFEYAIAPDLFSQQDNLDQQFHHYKRQKIYEDDYSSGAIFFDRIVPSPSVFQDFAPLPVPVPEVIVPPPVYSSSNACSSCSVEKGQQGERTLSAQSIAARQRRRKITEKTQELGKLVPGGHKMNTAEMLQSAFKYVKYLQAQVALLESMASFEDYNGVEHHSLDLQALVAFPMVQEKLYSTEKCLIPTNFLKALENDQEIQSNPTVLKQVRQVIRTCG